jgi:prolipoprotein diacylglyceryltransferase
MAQRKYMIFVKDWLVNIFPVCLLFVVSEAPVEMQGSFFWLFAILYGYFFDWHEQLRLKHPDQDGLCG